MTYENKTNQTLQIIDSNEVNTEINSLIERCTKELVIFSSIKVIHIILSNNNYLNSLSRLLKREVTIRILIDGVDQHLMRYITQINAKIGYNMIQFLYSHELGNFEELVILSDNKYLLRVKYDQNNKLRASFSNEKLPILVQQVLFEKYWNEVESHTARNN